MMRCPINGFTLIEVVVVLAIIFSLTILALPAYQRHINTSNRALAAAAILETSVRQQQFFAENKRYARSMLELGYSQESYGLDRRGKRVKNEAANRVYIVELATEVGAFTVRAIPQLAQSNDNLCGIMSLTSSGIRSVDGKGSAGSCW
ncbi:MAG: type IV pilus assembly protein PilE [Halioglobus sp.]|jgi:type IV pilus assembly protein PilE